MGYIIMSEGRKGVFLFLVDRRIIKNRWWDDDCKHAFVFNDKNAAEIQANKLIYRMATVVSTDEAKRLSIYNEKTFDYNELVHPFSSDAFEE